MFDEFITKLELDHVKRFLFTLLRVLKIKPETFIAALHDDKADDAYRDRLVAAEDKYHAKTHKAAKQRKSK